MRGDAEVGVKEVGEHVKRFPPKDYNVRFVNRQCALLDDNRKEDLESSTHGCPFNEWSGRDIVGIIVEEKNKVNMKEWR